MLNRWVKICGGICVAVTGAAFGEATSSAPANAASVDLSSPEAAQKAIVAAAEKSDVTAFRECWTSDSDLAKDFVNGYSELMISTNQLQQAILKKFGEPSAIMGGADSVLAGIIAKGKLKVTGDTAVITPAEGSPGSPYHLKKVGDQWKFDPAATFKLDDENGKKMAKDAVAIMPKTTKIIRQLREELESGKISDFKGFDARAKELMSQLAKERE